MLCWLLGCAESLSHEEAQQNWWLLVTVTVLLLLLCCCLMLGCLVRRLRGQRAARSPKPRGSVKLAEEEEHVTELPKLSSFDARLSVPAPPSKALSELELPPDWEMHQDGEGVPYYFNVATGETRWEHPCSSLDEEEHLAVHRRMLTTREVVSDRSSDRSSDRESSGRAAHGGATPRE